MTTLREALVRLGRHRSSAILIVLVLALTIGASGAIFSVAHAVLLRGLPYPHADRLVMAAIGGPSWSPAMLQAVEAGNSIFDAMAGIHERRVSLSGTGTPAVIRLEAVSLSYFGLLGAAPIAGGLWGPEHDVPAPTAAVAVISSTLGRQIFGDAGAAVGRPLFLDGTRVTIVGVMPQGFASPIGRADIWVPLRFASAIGASGAVAERPWSRWFEVIGRLRDAVPPAEASARFEADARRAMAALPGADQALGSRWNARVTPLNEALGSPRLRRAALLLLGSVLLLLLLACANLAGLQLIAAANRRREFAVRAAIGASPRRLAALTAAEVLLLIGAGAAAGLLVQSWIVDALRRMSSAPDGSFGLRSAELLPATATGGIGAFAGVAVSAAVTAVFVAAPPLVAASRRNGSADLRVNPSAAPGFSRMGSGRVAATLVAAEIALALVVLASAALMVLSIRSLWAEDRGFDPRQVVAVELVPPAQRSEGASLAALHAALVQQASAMPGVETASVASCAPGVGRCRRTSVGSVDGEPLPGGRVTVGVTFTAGNHFDLLRARIVRGRPFDARDSAGSPRAVIVNESAARRLWPGQDPVGRRLSLSFANRLNTEDREVVGVVEDIRYDAVEAEPLPDVYVPGSQFSWPSTTLFVRTAAGQPFSRTALRAAIDAVDSDIAIADVASLEDRLARGFTTQRMLANTLAVFAVSALVLAVTGLYGLVANAVTNGRREIGVRLALGATRGRIAGLMARRLGWLLVPAMAAGLAGAGAAARALAAFLHGVAPGDPRVFAGVAALLAAAVAAAAAFPVLSAVRTDPAGVLRDSG